MTPTVIFDLLAAVMLVVAAVSAARLVAARPWRPGSVIIDTDIAHLLMAIAMAGVLASTLRILPDVAWEVIFGALIAWYAGRVALDARANGIRALAGGHCAPHLVHSGAMLYMFLGMTSSAGAMAGMAGMAGMAAGSSSMLMLSDPTLAFAFALVLIGYGVWDLDQLSGRRYRLAAAQVAQVAQVAQAELAGVAGSGPAPASAEPAAAAGFLLSPGVTIGARVAMGVVMTFMLLIAI